MIGSLTGRAAAKFGDAVAIITGGVQFSFAEIDARVAAFAGGLRAIGINEGDRVVLHLPNGWRWIVAYYAVARIGAVIVPANILLSLDEVGFIASNARATALVSSAERCAGIATRAGQAAKLLMVATEDRAGNLIDFDALLAHPPVPIVERKPGDLCSIGYTSGTTGHPKGAMLSNRAIHTSAAMTATMHVRQAGDVVVSALPLPHVYGNIVLHCAFLCGMTLVVMERFIATEAIDLLVRHKATIFEGVPTMYHYLLGEPALAKADLSSLKRCTVGGQTMPTSAIEAVEASLGCPLLELWGMTEVAGPAVSHSPYTPARHGSIGLPFPGMEVRVADADDPNADIVGEEPGELLVRGPLVMDGYFENSAATCEALSPDGWLRTGDIVRRDADGYLYVLDRKKDMIITAGYNIYPAELEQAIAAHPAVSMVAVTSAADPVKGELAKAFVVCKVGVSVEADELLAHCRTLLASYKVPRLIEFVADLPKTSTGKILRRELRQPALPPCEPAMIQEDVIS